MAEEKKATAKAEPPKLARAAESGDPSVQYLLAEAASWGSVGNTDKVAEVERKLNDLGYTSK
jgi:hypothetical protein